MTFGFIGAEKANYPVRVLCKTLSVSPSGYYAFVGRPKSQRATEDDALGAEVTSIHEGSKKRYGSPRVHRALKAQGKKVVLLYQMREVRRSQGELELRRRQASG